MPSEDEWYKAAFYNPATSSYYLYPTASNTASGRDLSEATNPGNNGNFHGMPIPIQSSYYPTLVGEFELSQSPYGTFDQGGNLWEWNEAVILTYYRGLRGGAHSNQVNTLQAGHRHYAGPMTAENNYGFRVVYVPEPASIALLSLGITGLLLHRKDTERS